MNKTRNTLPPQIRKEAIAVLNNTAADLLTDILRALDPQPWLLEAHINRQQT